MHLRQPGFTYSTCGPFTKCKKQTQKFKETRDRKHIYKNELDKACFEHDMAYGDFKGLARRTASDNVLRDNAFSIAKNTNYDGYQRGLASVVYNFFDKKLAANKSAFKNEKITEQLHKPIIKNCYKRTVYYAFKDNIWGADLADMQSLSKFKKGFRFSFCMFDIFSNYA